jgi:hypothetical protein
MLAAILYQERRKLTEPAFVEREAANNKGSSNMGWCTGAAHWRGLGRGEQQEVISPLLFF